MAKEDAGQENLADWHLVLSARAAILGYEEAQHVDRVKHFRRHLPDGLLSADPKKVRAWIAKSMKEAEASNDRKDPAGELDLKNLANAMRQPHLGHTPRVVPDPKAAPEKPVWLSIYVQLAGRAFAMPVFRSSALWSAGRAFLDRSLSSE